MSYRALIFDNEKVIRKILWAFFDNRGYQVFTFPHPGICPLSGQEICPCSGEESCADLILSDLRMPLKNGIDFLEDQIKKGCKCKNFALMSGDFSDEDISRAESLGVKIFKKPFRLKEITKWLDHIENDIDPKRQLSDWFLNKIPEISKNSFQ